MSRSFALPCRRAAAILALLLFAALAASCGALRFDGRPAAGYTYASGDPLRIALIDETGGNDWTPALQAATATYAAAASYLEFQSRPDDANIVMHVRRYDDEHPPQLKGYVFPIGAGGFATVYDSDGFACNYPPSTLPLSCSGEIAKATIYLNDIIPAGTDIETRRQRLILHEMGHALGLTRHSPELDVSDLAQRYGWQ